MNAGLPVILDDGAQYIYGTGLVAQVSGANTYYYLADGLGSTMATTDASGAIVNSYTYDVYGKTTASSGSQANDFQFAGQQTDPTGLQYLRARYYDPETGGFLSRDPLFDSPIWAGNAYSYADGGPCNNTDDTGLATIPGAPPGSRKDCGQIYRHITRQIGVLLKRIQDYRADLSKLPEDGPMSRTSHREQYQLDKKGLNKRLGDWDDNGCGSGGGPASAIKAWVIDLGRFLGEYGRNLGNLDEWLPISSDDGNWLQRGWKTIKERLSEIPPPPENIWWNKPIPIPAPPSLVPVP